MTKLAKPSSTNASDRIALRRSVKQMYDAFNRDDWEKCYSCIDPKLRQAPKTSLPLYAENLQAFKNAYGAINVWYIRISLHLDESSKKQGERAFAYVYVVWQDADRGFHMFRERWVKDSGHWYSRVLGLVPNRQLPK